MIRLRKVVGESKFVVDNFDIVDGETVITKVEEYDTVEEAYKEAQERRKESGSTLSIAMCFIAS